VNKLWWVFKIVIFSTALATLAIACAVAGDVAFGAPPQFTALALLGLFIAGFGVMGVLRRSREEISADRMCDATEAAGVAAPSRPEAPPTPEINTAGDSKGLNSSPADWHVGTAGAARRGAAQAGAVFRSAMFFRRDTTRAPLRNEWRNSHETVT
jgi:hypothetical protein